MFVQVMKGHLQDPSAVRPTLDDWLENVAPGSSGWLGTTSGTTADGEWVSVVRFESPAAARESMRRPEQSEWWAKVAHVGGAAAESHECTRVFAAPSEQPREVGFVQVRQGRVKDPERSLALMSATLPQMVQFRPDVVGRLIAAHDDDPGAFTQLSYFTSEQEAREGERKPPPPELTPQMVEMASLMVGPLVYFDLAEHWLGRPR